MGSKRRSPSKGRGRAGGTRRGVARASKKRPFSPPSKREPARPRFFKPFFLDRLKIGPLMGQRLGSAGIHGHGESQEYLVKRGHVRHLDLDDPHLNGQHAHIETLLRSTEIWHRYDLQFEDRYDLDDIYPIFSRYLDPALKPFYNTFAILKVEIAVTDKRGRIIAQGTRAVSAIFEYQDLADSITYNVNNWVKKGDYDTVLGMTIELRAPTWYERANLERIIHDEGD